MNIKWFLQRADRFAESAAVWDELNSRCGGLPFLDTLFIQPLLEVFGSGQEWLAIGSENNLPVAAAILSPAGMGRWSLFQPSQMPLGPLLTLPALPLDEVAASLLKQLPGTTLLLGLTQIDPAVNAKPVNGNTFSMLDYIDTAWVDISGDFESYWASRGKNLRQNMRKQRNKLAADGIETALDTLRDAECVSEALRQYGVLETTSWKFEGGTAVSLDNDQGRFYAAVFESFCRAGRGVIYRYRFGDHVVAMDLCIESTGLLVILKTAYDGSNKSLSPAFLMREEQFQKLFSEGRIQRVEFFGKLLEWHTRWSEERRTLYHANAYRYRIIPKLLEWRAKMRAGQRAKHEQVVTENA